MATLRLIFGLMLAYSASAADIYVSQTAQGSDTGANAANAHSAAWFNNAANWGNGAGQIGAGTTVHLCGTFTGNVGDILLQPVSGGSSNAPVTLLFEPGCKLLSAVAGTQWRGSLSLLHITNMVVDGQGVGLIASTNNGTGLAYSNAVRSLYLEACSYVTIKGMVLTNSYRNLGSQTNSTDRGGEFTSALYIFGDSDHVRVCSNSIYGGRAGIEIAFEDSSINSVEVDHNYCADHCWGIVCGGPGNSHATNLLIHDNEVTDFQNWWFPGGNYPSPEQDLYHTDGIFVFGGNFATPVSIYNNYCHGDLGYGSPTAFIYTSTATQAKIYNNLLVATGHNILPLSYGGWGNNLVANNTIRCFTNVVGQPMWCGGTNNLLLNNLVMDGQYTESTQYEIITNSAKNADYNCWWNIERMPGNCIGGTDGYFTWPTWLGMGNDLHSITNNPMVDANYKPLAGSPLIGAGTNLSMVFTTDLAGNTRSTWDIGAYAYSTTPTTPPAPASGGWTVGTLSVGTLQVK